MRRASDLSTRDPEPGGEPAPLQDRYERQDRYLELTRRRLPAAAVAAAGRGQRWPIRFDHCFMRVALDHVFRGSWYDHLDRRLRAYKQLDDGQLDAAIGHAEAMLAGGKPVVEAMNRQSLAWRGKG